MQFPFRLGEAVPPALWSGGSSSLRKTEDSDGRYPNPRAFLQQSPTDYTMSSKVSRECASPTKPLTRETTEKAKKERGLRRPKIAMIAQKETGFRCTALELLPLNVLQCVCSGKCTADCCVCIACDPLFWLPFGHIASIQPLGSFSGPGHNHYKQ